MAVTPLSRSLALLRRRGYTAEKVEQRLPRGFVTRDLFGCIDLLAVRPGEIVGVQTTTRSNVAARRSKALGCPGLAAWLRSGGKFLLHGWAKVGGRGQRKTWQVAEQELTLADIPTPTPSRGSAGQAEAARGPAGGPDAAGAKPDALPGTPPGEGP